MKKLTTFALPILAFGLIACSGNDANANNNVVTPGGNSNVTQTVTAEASTHELYAFEAATSVGLLGELNLSNAQAAPPLMRAASDDVVNQIKEYLPSIEGALLGQDVLTSTVTATSDREGYETMMTVTYKDINLANESFTMYFNETVEVDDDDDDDRDDELEQESRIDGIVLVDGAEYTIRGEKELEGDEMEVKFTYQISDNTWIKVEQEKENGEEEFAYEIYENGNKVYEYSLEIEKDEVDLEVKDRSTLTDLEMKFEVYQNAGNTYIRAKIGDDDDNNESRIVFQKVTAEDGTVSWDVISNS